MAISVQCSYCQHSFTVNDRLAGKTDECPECTGQVNVPSLKTGTSYGNRGWVDYITLYGPIDKIPPAYRGSSRDVRAFIERRIALVQLGAMIAMAGIALIAYITRG